MSFNEEELSTIKEALCYYREILEEKKIKGIIENDYSYKELINEEINYVKELERKVCE